MTIQRNTTELQKDSQQNTYSDEAKTGEEATMQWLNVTRSYVYQLVRKNSLKALKLNPLVISTGSVIERIEETYPLVAQKCHQILNYSVKQDATHEFK